MLSIATFRSLRSTRTGSSKFKSSRFNVGKSKTAPNVSPAFSAVQVCPEFVERVQKFKVQCFQTKLIPILLKELASPGRLHVLRMLKTLKGPPIDISALDSGQSPQSDDMKAIFGQIVFDALRQLIREEINAALKRAGSTAATKKATRQE